MISRRKNHFLAAFAVSATLFIYGCSSAPIQVGGKSSASPSLKEQIIEKIGPQLNLETGCSSIDTIDVNTARLIRDKNNNIRGATEVWTVSGCGIQVNYPLKLGKDSTGKSYFELGSSF